MSQEKLNLIKEYLNFRLNAKPKGGHGIHSPFVYDLYTQCIDIKVKTEVFGRIEKVRTELLRNKTVITKNSFGAGSKTGNSEKKTVRDIAKSASIKPFTGRLLYRLVNYFKPETIIELGTSTGISTLYLAEGNTKSKVYSIEGDKSLCEIANENLNKLGVANVSVICGEFDEQIPILLNKIEKFDLAFIDGNHTAEATLKYFKLLSAKAGNESLIILDDIRWSNEMLGAWNTICADSSVSISIDLFNCGLVFFRKGIVKQHFYLRYAPF